MKKLLKNKKVWIGVAVVVIVFAIAMLVGDSTPVDATTQG
jgi:flagellar biosynthesis/type III secretory pathway M-ring protein FliF/YscJ|tara:strand:+ start:1291 stop:1410 length:120 start_codon:yes stop_codon:yes gene_type:complete